MIPWLLQIIIAINMPLHPEFSQKFRIYFRKILGRFMETFRVTHLYLKHVQSKNPNQDFSQIIEPCSYHGQIVFLLIKGAIKLGMRYRPTNCIAALYSRLGKAGRAQNHSEVHNGTRYRIYMYVGSG